MYSFSRCFYPKRLTIEEYNKQYIIKRQTVTGSACHTTFQALFRAKLARQEEVKERAQQFIHFLYEGAEVKWWWKRWVFRCRLKIVRDSAKAAINDYFDNRLVGRLFFRLIGLNKIILFYWQNTLFHILLNVLQTNWMLWKHTVLNLLDHLKRNKYFRNVKKKFTSKHFIVIYWANYKQKQLISIYNNKKWPHNSLHSLCTFWL